MTAATPNQTTETRWHGLRPTPINVALFLIVALAAFWRILYMANVSPFVDEYISMWAAMKILAHGYPRLASGNIYVHGIAHSYLIATSLALLGHSETAARIPSMVISLLTLPIVFHVGRRMFGWRAGLFATLLLAVDPDAITWGARARMYAFQQLCVLLAYYWLYRSDISDVQEGSTRQRFAFALAYAGAVFNQGISALLLPVMGLLVLWRRGWRHVVRWSVVLPFALAASSVAAVWELDRIGLPAMAMVAPNQFVIRSRPTFQPALDWSGMGKVLAPYAQLPYAPLVAVFFLGLVWLAVRLARERSAARSGTLPFSYSYAIVLGVLIEIFLLVGHSWKSPRFVFMLLPVFYLVVGAILDRALRPISRANLATGAVALLILATFLPSARQATKTAVWGYDQAFRWVRDHRGARDVVMTVNAPACAFVLGRCDYVAVEKGYEGYPSQDDSGRWVGGWGFVPLLTSTDQLRTVLNESPAVWFVVDRRRLHQRYTLEFVNLVWRRMDLVYQSRGALVFQSTETPPLASQGDQQIAWSIPLHLVGYALGSSGDVTSGTATARPGGELPIVLIWKPQARLQANYTVSLSLLTLSGEEVARQDEAPIHGRYPSLFWHVGETVFDRHRLALPANLPPGRYGVGIALVDGRTQEVVPLKSGEERVRLAEIELLPTHHTPQ